MGTTLLGERLGAELAKDKNGKFYTVNADGTVKAVKDLRHVTKVITDSEKQR